MVHPLAISGYALITRHFFIFHLAADRFRNYAIEYFRLQIRANLIKKPHSHRQMICFYIIITKLKQSNPFNLTLAFDRYYTYYYVILSISVVTVKFYHRYHLHSPLEVLFTKFSTNQYYSGTDILYILSEHFLYI